MNRTTASAVVAIAFVCAAGRAQEPAKAPPAAPQRDPIAAIVADLRTAEQRAKSFRLELATSGALPGGLQFSTAGTLSVLRGEQPAVRTTVAFTFANGLDGRSDTVHNADGITMYSDDAAFGEVLVHIPAVTVADLEWAGTVLQRADLPGMKDGRADAPLGSRMLDDLRARYDLKATERKDRAGAAGQWFAGERRGGTGDQDPDLPMATRCEVFVRLPDAAVLEVVHYQADKVLQRIEVKQLDVDKPLPAGTFAVDGHGQKMRELAQFPPLAETVERTLVQAEAKAGEGVLRPSKRK